MDELRYHGYHNPRELLEKGAGTFSVEEIIVVLKQMPGDMEESEKRFFVRMYFIDRLKQLRKDGMEGLPLLQEGERMKKLLADELLLPIRTPEVRNWIAEAEKEDV